MAAVGMADQRVKVPGLRDVEHINQLSDNIGALFMEENYSDMTLVIENRRFPVHKVVLAARSEYFRALLYGGMRESLDCQVVELKSTPAEGFYHLLKYVYTGRISLGELKEETLLEVLGLANQYGFVELQSSISEYLKAVLNKHNVCNIYDIANMYSLRSLSDTCCLFMDHNAYEVLQMDGFRALSPTALYELVSRDSFCAPEIDIFKAIQSWVERNTDQQSSVISHIMTTIRLPLIRLDDLLSIVRDSNLMSADSILDAIKLQNECRNTELNYRGFLIVDENVATGRYQATVIRGEMKTALLDGDSTNYDLDRGFTRHPIDEANSQGIVIKLGQPCIINSIRMLLWDRDVRSYSYYIEGSLDDKDWVRLVDHTKFLCRSWQNLRFPARVVRYVRIVGTHNTVNRVFHLVSFECSYTNRPCTLDNGIIVPTENVATMAASACVIEGVSRSRNALINGDTEHYDWDSGYTCHQLGSGAIVIQLAQPYVISSMRLLLWDCDGRRYSYYVEVSNNQQNWTRVIDKSREECQSWQTILFDRQPVTFVRIVGTRNTANEVFHCVHFECPADPNAVAEEVEQRAVQAAAQVKSFPSLLSQQAMEVESNRGSEETSRIVHIGGQLPRIRLQGLGRADSRDEGPNVDNGDGYGIGLMGGASGSPSHAP